MDKNHLLAGAHCPTAAAISALGPQRAPPPPPRPPPSPPPPTLLLPLLRLLEPRTLLLPLPQWFFAPLKLLVGPRTSHSLTSAEVNEWLLQRWVDAQAETLAFPTVL
ncbi:hypothetical protein TGAMA5MH_08887 [Trichoderma gamsii]|uniref:Uncharacterized protein n=1 Tax=Trichoderma gamsii TaxID=398673 RepID=A0A2K0T125_9HYPO|nr:hypothetical protein TGAMA5MH_08887 [Trichoderma gamsii]